MLRSFPFIFIIALSFCISFQAAQAVDYKPETSDSVFGNIEEMTTIQPSDESITESEPSKKMSFRQKVCASLLVVGTGVVAFVVGDRAWEYFILNRDRGGPQPEIIEIDDPNNLPPHVSLPNSVDGLNDPDILKLEDDEQDSLDQINEGP